METNERKPVDVIAVMKADALAAEEWRFKQAGDAYAFAACKTSNEARAAVAELIEREKLLAEAAHAFRQWFNSGLPDSRDPALFRKAEALNRAALARCGGAP